MAEFASNGYVVGIVGATGAVGIEVIKCLHKKRFPLSQLHLYASSRSAGKSITTGYGDILIEEFSVDKCRSCQFVFLAVSGEFALEHAQVIASDNGPYVIDNSSAFRYNPEFPLVIPEINPESLIGAKLIANPNCTTAIAAVALWPIHKQFKIKKLIMSTYQAASGAGAEGMEELLTGTTAHLKGEAVTNTVFVHPLPFNLIPHIDKFQANGYTKEEMKVVWETKKIFGVAEDGMKVSCTAVRIPIMRAHSEAITIETEAPINPDQVRELLSIAPGVRVVDDVSNNCYPMPLNASESYDVEVGRIRSSLIYEPNGIDLFVSGDQLLRGAALNAVLIAEKIIELGNR
eukprot:gene14369-19271_t